MAVTETTPVSRNLDGYAYPFTDKRGTFLVVNPPRGEGRPIDYDSVERELKKMNIAGVDFNRVRQAVAEASGNPAWILTGPDPQEEERNAAEAAARAKEEAKIDKSQYIFMTVSEDALTAKLTLMPPEDKRVEITPEDLQKLIDGKNIKFGLDEERHSEALEIIERIKEGEWTDPVEVEIARGIEPQHGQDAQYEFFFEQDAEAAAKTRASEDEEGRVDYFAVREIENTKRGQVIARRIPPTKGIPGKSIHDEEIPARDGAETTITVGRGVDHALGNENILVAAVDGQVKLHDRTLEVLELFEVQGDVDLSTGSIDFVGAVVVHGNVQPGFKIAAGEDVLVEGVVDDAEIVSQGSVTIKGGILGQGGKAKVTCTGDLSAKYIRNASILTKGKLTAQEGILHSKVTAHSIKLSGKRGQIVGGEIVAETDVIANTIGSNSSATPTVITVGESVERRDEIAHLTEKVRSMEEELDKAKKAAASLKAAQERSGSLSPERKEFLAKVTRMQFKLNNDLKPAQERLQHLLSEEEEAKKQGKASISAMGRIYPGVKVAIRGAKKTIVEEQQYCTLTERGAEVKVGSFK